MPCATWDQYFVHQLPRTFDQVNDSERSWSDRCYFNAVTPDGTLMLVTGFGNHPNTQHAHGYAKLSLADGRHWDLDAVRRSTDRAELYAGPMRWTCVEPLKHWQLELGSNDSGIEWDLHYRARALWELLPITIRKRGRVLADMQHIKQPGDYTGWIRIDGAEIAVDGLIGGRDRNVRDPRQPQHRLLGVVRGGVRGPGDRSLGHRIVGRHGPVRRRRHHLQRRSAVEAVRQVPARCHVRRRPPARLDRGVLLRRRRRRGVPTSRRGARNTSTRSCTTARCTGRASRRAVLYFCGRWDGRRPRLSGRSRGQRAFHGPAPPVRERRDDRTRHLRVPGGRAPLPPVPETGRPRK